jgi:hypothetical protein
MYPQLERLLIQVSLFASCLLCGASSGLRLCSFILVIHPVSLYPHIHLKEVRLRKIERAMMEVRLGKSGRRSC